MEFVFFENWSGLLHVFIAGIVAFVAVLFMIRVSGKRTISQMKEFDFIVSVALGSALATMILDKSLPLLEGILAVGILIGLQFIIAKLSLRSETMQKLSTSGPTLLFYNGHFLYESMKKERLLEDDIRTEVRSQGIARMSDVSAVVLEPNGQVSVVKGVASQDAYSSLHGLQ